MKKMKYSLYRKCYSQFPASDYDTDKKTVMVDVPKMPKQTVPEDWDVYSNGWRTSKGTRIYFYNSGYARNYLVEHTRAFRPTLYADVPAGLDSFQRMLEAVKEMEGKL